MARIAGLTFAVAAMLWTLIAPTAAQETGTTAGDWRAVCDAENNCSASTKIGTDTDGFVARYILQVSRQAGENASWTIAVSTIATLADRDRPVEFRIDDNAPLTLRPKSGYAPFGTINDFFILDKGTLKTVFAQMIRGNTARFTFLDVTAGPHDVDFSLAGLSAVLDWIDTAQKRRGSPRVAAPPDHIEPAPEIDKSLAVARLGVPPRLLHVHRSASRCEDPNSEHMSSFQPLIVPVSRTAMLYGIPCMAGAANTGYRLYIVESGEIGGIEPIYFSIYTDSHGWAGTDVLFNISFDRERNQLTSRFKGRDRGDCGNVGTWVWKKYAFAMHSFRSWSRCDGSRRPDKWPVIFRNKSMK